MEMWKAQGHWTGLYTFSPTWPKWFFILILHAEKWMDFQALDGL